MDDMNRVWPMSTRPWRNAGAAAVAAAIVLAPCTGAAAGVRHPQTPAVQEPAYEPQEGQDGKDVVWVPTHEGVVKAMLDLTRVTASDVVIDLGSGDGRTVIAAARRGATARGIEYNPEMVALARRNAEAAGVSERATFEQADLYETDLSEATVITMFLLPTINLELRPTLLDLKPGTRIASNSFNMDDWEPDYHRTIEDDCRRYCTALVWVVPAKVAGSWKLNDSSLQLTQDFQMVTGTLNGDPISEGRLLGDMLTFVVGPTRYHARVSGDTMVGTANGRPWQGARSRPVDQPVDGRR